MFLIFSFRSVCRDELNPGSWPQWGQAFGVDYRGFRVRSDRYQFQNSHPVALKYQLWEKILLKFIFQGNGMRILRLVHFRISLLWYTNVVRRYLNVPISKQWRSNFERWTATVLIYERSENVVNQSTVIYVHIYRYIWT